MARCGPAEPGLEPGGDETPGLVAVIGVEQVCGLDADESLTRERLGGVSLAEAALLQGHVSCGTFPVKMKESIETRALINRAVSNESKHMYKQTRVHTHTHLHQYLPEGGLGL